MAITTINGFIPDDLSGVVDCWNRHWEGVQRSFPASTDQFKDRVFQAPGFGLTSLLVAKDVHGQVEGFVHFGPRESWWFLPSERSSPEPANGMIYALSAESQEVFQQLFGQAETKLLKNGAQISTLWPSWAQGCIPFYNGLTPSNEVSGLWHEHLSARWITALGYDRLENYYLGEFSQSKSLGVQNRDGFKILIEPFETPLIPNSIRFALLKDKESIGRVIMAPCPERRAQSGVNEWSAFDVFLDAPYRGKGLGHYMMTKAMQWAFESEGADLIQLHVQANNPPALKLYFDSIGFRRDDRWIFSSFRKVLSI